ncbi:MAG: phosphate acyltransferase, partial [Planctomycetota bacterium]
MSSVMEQLRSQARAARRRVILPESADPRVRAAARQLVAEGLAEVWLVASSECAPGSAEGVR